MDLFNSVNRICSCLCLEIYLLPYLNSIVFFFPLQFSTDIVKIKKIFFTCVLDCYGGVTSTKTLMKQVFTLNISFSGLLWNNRVTESDGRLNEIRHTYLTNVGAHSSFYDLILFAKMAKLLLSLNQVIGYDKKTLRLSFRLLHLKLFVSYVHWFYNQNDAWISLFCETET